MIEPLGTQLWADIRWRDGWRVQRRWNDQSARLVDPRGRAVYHGCPAECDQALQRLSFKREQHAHLVILLHGLGRTRRSLRRLDGALRDAGLVIARLDYPSTRRSIEEHASVVAQLLDQVPTPARLSFVGHSLGALIIRRLLAHGGAWRASATRVVMLAPPNQGASLATALGRYGLFRKVLGPSFVQIAEGCSMDLPIPDLPTAIFAGDALGAWGDGLVKVPETRLTGMAEHQVVRAIHTFIMNHPAVIEGVVSFLRSTPEHR
jgi:pimeloyl-ACP methyl ester carboxylesterase